MTNAQAQGYAVVTLRNLIKNGIVKADTTEACRAIYRGMYDLMDIMSEEEAEEKSIRVLQGMVK